MPYIGAELKARPKDQRITPTAFEGTLTEDVATLH